MHTGHLGSGGAPAALLELKVDFPLAHHQQGDLGWRLWLWRKTAYKETEVENYEIKLEKENI